MKTALQRFLFPAVLLAAGLARAEPAVSDVVVNQRWPWNEKVDVDFLVTGGALDVEVSATWDGQSEPYVLGTNTEAKSGWNRLTWDPALSPYAGRTLTGFSVTLTPLAVPADRYLIVDLVNGGVSYATRPDGTDGLWSDAYKTTKMVFRRIPAGSYELGEPKDSLTYLGLGDTDATTYNKITKRRTVTFTHDFYVGIFRYTTAQDSWLMNGCAGGDTRCCTKTYNDLRGGTNAVAELNVDWPNTRYAVASASVVARLRAKAGAFTVDLCEDEQWEVAARAKTTTFWPSGGTTNESYAVLSNEVNRIAVWRGNEGTAGPKPVGQKDANGWGLHDIVGAGAAEWVLDSCTYCNKSRTLPGGTITGSTDPVGGHGTGLRIYRSHSGYGTSTKLVDLLPCMRRAAEPATFATGVRFCIHLEPLPVP